MRTRLFLSLFALLTSLFFLAATPIPIPPADFPRPPQQKSPLGINLEQLVDFSRSMMFTDLIKSARKFGSPDKPWDQSAPLDQNGWPTADAGIVVVADAPISPGDYSFSCTGHCTLDTLHSKASVKSQSYDHDTKTMTATITVEDNADTLFLSLKSTDHGIQNIRLLRPGYLLKSNEPADIFNKDFLTALAPFSTLRTMDLTRTNGNESKEWADRAKTTDALQSSPKGVAWEYLIQLANQSKKDLWINIPALASDDYVKQLAQLLKSSLNKDRIVYLEYSNEVWNSIFPQFRQNLDAAKAEVAKGNSTLDNNGSDKNEYYWSWKRVPKRLLEITKIFSDVYNPQSSQLPITNYQLPPNIRPVLASQSANPFMAKIQLDFIEQKFGPPNKFIYALAGAPYLGLESKISDLDTLTTDDLFKTHLPQFQQTINQWILDYQTLARFYRVHHLSYEGGPALEGEHSLQAKLAANRDDRIATTLQTYFTAWYSSGGELFMYYNLASNYGNWGAWGATEDLRKSSPKLKTLLQIAATPTPPITAGTPIPGTIQLQPNTTDYLLLIQSPGNYKLSFDPAPDEIPDLLISSQIIPTPTTTLIHLTSGQLTLRLRSPANNLKSIKLEKQ